MLIRFLLFTFFITILEGFFFHTTANEKKIYIYNWSDYIAENTIQDFEKKTGIKIIYDVFDSNEILEGKLMAGNIGYDIVVPSSSFLSRQLEFGIFQPIQKEKLLNYKNLDFSLMKKLEQHDPKNKYAIPYLWGTTGIGYNFEKVKEALGENPPVNSWDLILDLKNLKKLKSCGVSFLDAPEEIFAIILNYLKKNPNSNNIDDYKKATDLLLQLRPYIRYFHSSHYIDDLATGNLCAAIGWAGDILQIKHKNFNSKKINIDYSIPKEGTVAFFDTIAIPKDAKNISEIYKFIDYILEPKTIANITNKMFYSNVNKASIFWIDKNIRNNSSIYPTKKVMLKLFMLENHNLELDRFRTKAWTKIKIS